MIAAMLVDDEPLANAGMRQLLSAHGEIEITAVVGSLAEARTALRAHQPSVVFLDVEMPGGDTFSLLPELDEATRVVFVTAHERYAVDAFAVGAVDYLVKPVDPDRLAETIRRLSAPAPDDDARHPAGELSSAEPTAAARLTVPLRESGLKAVVDLGDICWIESLRNYTRVAMQNPPRLLIFRRRLSEWLTDLPEATFARISRSEAIQLSLLTHTEWKSRSETRVLFGGGVEPMSLGRASTQRLNALLADG